MAPSTALSRQWGDPTAHGYDRSSFPALRSAGDEGSGIDTVVILEERIDLRIQIEATLGELFGREVTFTWDSGRLIPMVRRSDDQVAYRLDRDECHGIKELVVLLTHLYDTGSDYLIIDEPELNLHPQHQAFFMQEVRRLSGDPHTDAQKKVVFLITHSPFILDLRTDEDLASVVSFDLEYSVPKRLGSAALGAGEMSNFVRHLNAHHKQFFFADNPIFVEGSQDADIIEALISARGASVAAAGSCIVIAGGKEAETQYLPLCTASGKLAHFVYDLDSLFSGGLRQRIRDSTSIREYLVEGGHGPSLDKYVGQLEKLLATVAKRLRANRQHPKLAKLHEVLNDLDSPPTGWSKPSLLKARTSVATAISMSRGAMVEALGETTVADIEGRIDTIVTALRESNIHVLPGGTLERYLPSFEGNLFSLSEDAKRKAVRREVDALSRQRWSEEKLAARYGDLYSVVARLPSSRRVDDESVVRRYLSDLIYKIQQMLGKNPHLTKDEISSTLASEQRAISDVFRLTDFDVVEDGNFQGTISVAPMLGKGVRVVQFSNRTNAGMSDFEIRPSTAENEPSVD